MASVRKFISGKIDLWREVVLQKQTKESGNISDALLGKGNGRCRGGYRAAARHGNGGPPLKVSKFPGDTRSSPIVKEVLTSRK